MRIKYTKEILSPIVQTSFSITEVIRKLGLQVSGGSHKLITQRIKDFGIDNSHFLGQGWNKGNNSNFKRSYASILILNDYNAPLERSKILRRALLESGAKEECNICGQDSEWNNRPLRLQVDHKNGKRYDNRKVNLRFLCPNCHTQTDNWGALNKTSKVLPFIESKDAPSKCIKQCQDCNRDLPKSSRGKSIRCRKCNSKKTKDENKCRRAEIGRRATLRL